MYIILLPQDQFSHFQSVIAVAFFEMAKKSRNIAKRFFLQDFH